MYTVKSKYSAIMIKLNISESPGTRVDLAPVNVMSFKVLMLSEQSVLLSFSPQSGGVVKVAKPEVVSITFFNYKMSCNCCQCGTGSRPDLS